MRADRAAGAGGQSPDVNHILDGDWNSMQWAAHFASPRFFVQHLRLRPRAVAVDDAPALNQALDGVDPVQACLQDLTSADAAACDCGGDIVDRAGIRDQRTCAALRTVCLPHIAARPAGIHHHRSARW
jgi:hypothetical protein